MLLTARGFLQESFCKPRDLKKGAVSAKMTGKTSLTKRDTVMFSTFPCVPY